MTISLSTILCRKLQDVEKINFTNRSGFQQTLKDSFFREDISFRVMKHIFRTYFASLTIGMMEYWSGIFRQEASVTTRAITFSIYVVIAAFILSGAAAWASDREKNSGDGEKLLQAEDTLLHIKSESETGTDGRFTNLLDSLGLKNDLQAPSRLRAFMTSLPIVRASIGAGYSYSIRRASLVWVTGDCIVAGRREQVLQLLLKSMSSTGLKESGKEEATVMTFTLEEGGLIYSLSFMKPEDIMIEGRPFCKTKLYCRVGDSNVSPVQPLGRIMTVFPFLKDRRIEDAFYDELASTDVEMVTLGGASVSRYEWEAILIPSEKDKNRNKNKVTLLDQMEAIFLKLGYARDTAHDATGTFIRKCTGSAVNLKKVAGSEKVHIRIKPEQ